MSLSAFSSSLGPVAYKSRQADFFELSPVPLRLEDWSDARTLLRAWKPADGMAVRELLQADPERLRACARLLRLIRVNKAALELYDAKGEMEMIDNVERTFAGDFLPGLADALSQLWDADACAHLTVNFTLSGRKIHVSTKCRVMPGRESDWGQVLVSAEDVTALSNSHRGH
jgi:PAS domain-containing protein